MLVLIPAIIRQAYDGKGVIEALRHVIQQPPAHPVAYYLRLWYRAAAALTFVLVALVALWWFTRAHLQRFTAVAGRALRSDPAVGLVDVVRIGFCLGVVGGLAETLSLALRFAFNPDPREAPDIDSLWMAPLATALLGALVSLLLGVVVRAWRGLSIAVPFALLSGFAAFSVIRGVKLGIHPYAAVVLAAGIAVELARRSRLHGGAFSGFIRRATPWVAVAILAGALGVQGFQWGRERSALAAIGDAPAGAPNVLLLILDTVRADDMGLYGYARNTTPEIERVAATGVTFDRAIASAPWTLPSHASMFTGLPAHKLSADFDRPLDSAVPTLAEVLGRQGYVTGGFVANPTYASRASGLDRGFATYLDHQLSVEELIDAGFWTRLVANRIRKAMGKQGRLVRKTAEDVNREVLDWIPSDGRPFFAFLNYFDAHEPYEPHEPFDRLVSKDSPRFWLIKGWQRRKSMSELEEIRAAYDGNIAYIDHHIGRLLKELGRRGVLENTIVIISSDHGEHFGEHGGVMSHANSLYLPLLHVPLVISYPPSVPAGLRVQHPVTLQDIAATVLHMVGGPDAKALPGASLAAHWRSPVDTTQPAVQAVAPAILSSLTYNTFSASIDPIQQGPMQSIVRANLHFIRNGDGREELYDVAADPREEENLAEANGGDPRLPELRRVMDEMMAGSVRAIPLAPPRPRE